MKIARRYSMNPWNDWSREWIRPWKLATLACGLALLCWGAIEERLADWDIGLSFLMGILTYLFAPWTIQVVRLAIATRPRGWWWHLAVAVFTAWAVIDGSYVGYSLLMGNLYVREANATASTPLYLLVGIVWSFRGSIADFVREVRTAVAR